MNIQNDEVGKCYSNTLCILCEYNNMIYSSIAHCCNIIAIVLWYMDYGEFVFNGGH